MYTKILITLKNYNIYLTVEKSPKKPTIISFLSPAESLQILRFNIVGPLLLFKTKMKQNVNCMGPHP